MKIPLTMFGILAASLAVCSLRAAVQRKKSPASLIGCRALPYFVDA